MNRRNLIILLCLALTLTIAATSASAGTITVRQDGTGDYTTLTAAVAASFPGDVIEIGPGTYQESPIDVTHGLELRSTDGPAATVLSGLSGGQIFRFSGGSTGCLISGLTFSQAHRTGPYISAVTIREGSQGAVEDCVFRDNNCVGLVVASGSDITVSNCEFTDNHESVAGASGIYITGAGTQTLVQDCRFEDNTTVNAGGGVSVVSGGTGTVERCTFTGNTASYGGGAHCWSATLHVSECLFVDNTGEGAAIYYRISSGSAVNNTLYQNTALFSPSTAVEIDSSPSVSFLRNIVAETFGGYGIWADEGANVDCCVFSGNALGPLWGVAPGTSVVADPGLCDPENGDFSVSPDGPAVAANSPCGLHVGSGPVGTCAGPPPPTGPGTIRVRQDGTGDYETLTEAMNASVPGDTIEIGPGYYAEDNIDVYHDLVLVSSDGPDATVLSGQVGGQIMRFSGAAGFRITGLTFTENHRTPDFIAGVTIRLGSQGIVENCVFTGGYSAGMAISSLSDVSVLNCEFTNGIESVAGTGGLYLTNGSAVLVQDCRFEGNTTAGAGGGTAVVAGAVATIVDCEYVNNQAVYGGAIHCGEGATANVSGCLFVGNSGIGGVAYFFRSAGLMEGNTLYGNTALPEPFGAILIQDTQGVTLLRNIVAGTHSGAGVSLFSFFDPASVTETCNIYWDNDLGPVSGQALDPQSVQADPVFCDPGNGVYTVSSLGAAAPDNSPCGQLVGAFPVDCAIEPPVPVGDEPVIISILDVPNDQGREVRIKWAGSGQDAAGTEYTITGYAIYRYQEMIAGSSPLMAPPPLDVPRGKGSQIDGWDYLVTVPARGDSVYQTTVETLCDARPNKLCSTAFFVSAMTADPLVYFDSAPDSGYSVDNLPPGPPSNLVASLATPGIHLSWTAPDAPDIESYRVYRGEGPDFALDASNMVAEIVDTEWNDNTGSAIYQYKVTTMDDGGNESEAAGVNTPTPTGTGARVFALQQNIPNPFNPSTVIPYNVGVGGGHVTLRVYDVAGRLVTTLVDEVQSPGPKAMHWDGRGRNGRLAASGTYFYRLTGPGFEKTLKMTLVQ